MYHGNRTLGHRVPLAAILLLASAATAMAGPLRVVATSPTFASLVREVGGDAVQVTAVSPPCDDIHFIEPKPSDIARLARADAFVHAGLDLELWRGPLVEASRNRAVFRGGQGDIDLSDGVELLEVPTTTLSRAEGDIHIYGNPHYWMDPDNVPILAAHLERQLSLLDPANADRFRANRESFVRRLETADAQWQESLAPLRGAAFVSYHRDWPYFARHFGLETGVQLEPKPNIPPSARHLQTVIATMKEQNLRVIVREPFHPEKNVRTVATATGGVEAELSQQTGCLPDTDDYISLMEANVQALLRAFRGESAP